MADSSRVQISYQKQPAKGTIATAPFIELRHTGGSFGATQETIRSDEIRGDGQRGKTTRVGRNPEGVINMEFSAKTFDDLIAGFLRSAWSTNANFSHSDTKAVASTSSFTTTAGDFTGKNIVLGQWVYVSGFTSATTNGWYKVESIAAKTLGVSPAPPNDNNTDAKTIKIEGSYIRNATTENYYAFQLEHLDLTNKLRLIKDAKIDQFSLSCNARGIVTGSFNFQGCTYSLETSKAGNGAITPAPDTEILNSTENVSGVFFDGAVYDGSAMSFTLSGNTNARRQNSIAQLESDDVRTGSIDVTGSLSIYLTDDAWATMLTKYDDFTKLSVAFPFIDADGNGYVIELPKVALTTEPGNIPGPDNDVMLEFDWAGEPGGIGAESKTIQISRKQMIL